MKRKGNAILELILILPFLCFLLASLHWLFRSGMQKQKELIGSAYRAKERLQTIR